MLSLQKVDLSFLHLTPANKTQFGQHIIDSFVANAALFPNLPFTVVVLKAANNLLISTGAAAQSGDHTAILSRNAAEKDWDDKMNKTATYVSFLAAGNPVLISQAGFTPTSGQITPTDAPNPASLKTLTPHDGGVLEITLDKPGGSKVAGHVSIVGPNNAGISTAADGTITLTASNGEKFFVKFDTHSATTMGGLDVGKMLKLVVQPVNHKGTGAVTTPKSFILQP